MRQSLHLSLYGRRHKCHVGSCLGSVSDVLDPVFDFERQYACARDALSRQVRTELAGDEDLIEVFHADAGFSEKRHEAREYRPLGKLHLAHVALCYVKRVTSVSAFSHPERALAVLIDSKILRPVVVIPKLISLYEGSGLFDESRSQKFLCDCQDAAPADARRLAVAYHLDVHSFFTYMNVFDSSLSSSHSRTYIHSFKSRTGSA